MDRYVGISKEKIVVYLKKFWWIIGLFFVAGLILFGWGVRGNEQPSQETFEYVQNLLPVSTDSDGQTVSATTVNTNCTVFLQMSDVQEEINNRLRSLNTKEIEQWGDITFSYISNSSFMTITISSENIEAAEEQIDVILDVLNEKMSQYDQSVEILLVGDPQQNVLTVEQANSVQLIDIIVFLAAVVIGILIVYLIMIFDSRISDAAEMRYFSGEGDTLCIAEKDMDLLKIWVHSRKEKQMLFLLGEGTDEVKKLIEENCGSNSVTVPLNSCETVLKTSTDKEKYLIIRAMQTKSGEVVRVQKILQMYNTKMDGWVYIR